MTAEVIQFRRDVGKAADDLVDVPEGLTTSEMLSRHRRLARLLAEAWDQKRSGRLGIEQVERITSLLDAFHSIALRAGVAPEVVRGFNAERDDWKAWKALRETLPRHCRM